MGRSRTRLLVCVLFGLFSTNLTFTVFNVALVDISKDLGTSSSTLTWAITGPLLVVGAAAPILGRLGDIHSHRRLYLLGLVGSLLCAVLTAGSWSAGTLIGARLFSGLGAACLTASSWALLFRVFPPDERTKVLGWWSLVGAGGPVIGVAIGGPVVQAFGWRWIFVAQVPLIITALVLNYRVLPGTERRRGEALDMPGALLLATAVAAVLYAVSQSSHGWTYPAVVGAGLIGVVAFTAFVGVERRAACPIFPLEWLSQRSVTLPCLAAFALNFAYMGGFFLTPLFLEQGLRYGVGAAGFFQIARPLVFAVAAPAAGYLAARTGERTTAIAGALVLTGSMLVFALLSKGSSPVIIVAALAASGLALGLATPSISALIANSVDVARMGSASGAMQLASQVGVVIGIQVMVTVQVSRQHAAGLVGSYHEAYVAGALVTLVAVGSALLIRNRRRRTAVVVTPRRAEAPDLVPEAAFEVAFESLA